MSDIIYMSKSLKVWSKFSVKKKDGTVLNFRIVDMPKYLINEVSNLYIDQFVKEENTFIAVGIPKNATVIEEIRKRFLEAIVHEGFHVMICCLDNGDDKIKHIIGASVMELVSKYDTEAEHEFKSEEMQNLSNIMNVLETLYSEMKAFDLDRCFSDRGLCVSPEYRGLGIAQEFLKARRLICKENGIPINGAWMTSYGTQRAAECDGWETVYELTNEQQIKSFGTTFGKDLLSYKFMIARIKL